MRSFQSPIYQPEYAGIRPTHHKWLARPEPYYLGVATLIIAIVLLGGMNLHGIARLAQAGALVGYLVYVALKLVTYRRALPVIEDDDLGARIHERLRARTPAWCWSDSPEWYLARGVLRTILLTVGVSILVGTIYWQRAHDHLSSGASDPLWLLYILAAYPLSKRHFTRAFMYTLLFILFMVGVTTVPFMAVTVGWSVRALPVLLGSLAAKWCWIVLLAGIMHYLLREQREQQANERLLRTAQELIAIPPPADGEDWEQLLLRRLLALLTASFPFATAGIWARLPDGSFVLKEALRGKASGIDLSVLKVRPGGYTLAPGCGLLSEVIRQHKPWAGNVGNTAYIHEQELEAERGVGIWHRMAHILLLATKVPRADRRVESALVVPISLASETYYGAIDLQATHGDAFTPVDLRVVSMVADCFSQALATAHWELRVATLADQAARASSITFDELQEVCATVAAALHEQIAADVVTIFVRPPGWSDWDLAAAHGDLRDADAFDRAATGHYPTIDRVANRPGDEDYVVDYAYEANLPAANDRPHGFSIREGLRARASLRVRRRGRSCLVIFLNFRRESPGTTRELERLRLIGNLLSIVVEAVGDAAPRELAAVH